MLTDSSVCWKRALKRIAPQPRPPSPRRDGNPAADRGEDPGIPERGPPDHHGIASGLRNHPPGVLRLPYVPVSDHDAVGEPPLQSLDLPPVGRAGKHLPPGARVEGDRSRPRLEDLPRHGEVRVGLRAEARPDLDGDGNPRGGGSRPPAPPPGP